MEILGPRPAAWLGIAGCLFWAIGCAPYAAPSSERVDRVPAGQYHVTISENRTGGERYNAVLFEAEAATVMLDAPAVERRPDASPDDYQAAMRSGVVLYEIRAVSGTIQAYLMVPPRTRVRVWDQPGKRGALVVTVSDFAGVPESGSGGGGGGGM